MAKRIYHDFGDAGRELAAELAKHRGSNYALLAIANSGVPVAIPIADKLEAQLDLLVISRLFVRDGHDLPVCAVNIGGSLLLDPELHTRSTIEEQFMEEAVERLSQRAAELRATTLPLSIAGKDVILVDNGMHTSSTMQIGIRALRRLDPSTITIAIPVADVNIRRRVETLADTVVCLQWCENFGNTALWYKNFNRPNDREVSQLIKGKGRRGKGQLLALSSLPFALCP